MGFFSSLRSSFAVYRVLSLLLIGTRRKLRAESQYGARETKRLTPERFFLDAGFNHDRRSCAGVSALTRQTTNKRTRFGLTSSSREGSRGKTMINPFFWYRKADFSVFFFFLLYFCSQSRSSLEQSSHQRQRKR